MFEERADSSMRLGILCASFSGAVWLATACPVHADLLDVDSAGDICLQTEDPCMIDQYVRLAPDAVLDFGARSVEIANGGVLAIGSDQEAELLAGNIFLRDSGAIELGERPANLNSGGSLRIEARSRCVLLPSEPCVDDFDCSLSGDACSSAVGLGEVFLDGPIVGSGASSVGRLELEVAASGDIAVTGLIDLSGFADAGRAEFESSAGDIVLNGVFRARGKAKFSFGGDLDIFTEIGNAHIGGIIDISGSGDSGSIFVFVDGDITVDAKITASSLTDGGFGGDIDFDAFGDVTVGSATRIVARGSSSLDQFGGDGGRLTVTADNASIADGAKIVLAGAKPDAFGGEAEILVNGDLQVGGKWVLSAGGRDSSSGEFFASAFGGITLSPSTVIRTRGGDGDQGGIIFDADGPLVVDGKMALKSRRSEGLLGPRFEAISKSRLTVRARVKARGGELGVASLPHVLSGCEVLVEPGAGLSFSTSAGLDVLAGRTLEVAAGSSLRSHPETSGISIRYGDASTPPVIAGRVQPDPVLTEDPQLATACP